jgi:hypothetical protein
MKQLQEQGGQTPSASRYKENRVSAPNGSEDELLEKQLRAASVDQQALGSARDANERM